MYHNVDEICNPVVYHSTIVVNDIDTDMEKAVRGLFFIIKKPLTSTNWLVFLLDFYAEASAMSRQRNYLGKKPRFVLYFLFAALSPSLPHPRALKTPTKQMDTIM